MYQTGTASAAYPNGNKLVEWDNKASVRSYPRRRFAADENYDGFYFVPELVPISQHPLVSALGPAAVHEILVQNLYTYLEATIVFELEVINSVAKQIAHKQTDFDLPPEMRFDVYKIYCDEGYHALFSLDLKRQVEATTGIVPHAADCAPLLRRMRLVEESLPSDLRRLLRIFVAIVFETMITFTLAKIPRDERVVKVVREVLADHAEDEARHHVYFCNLFELTWPQLDARQRAVIGPLLPQFIRDYVEPNYSAIKGALSRFDLSEDKIERVIAESYPTEQLLACAKDTSRVTLRLIERLGILADPLAYEKFQESGLLR